MISASADLIKVEGEEAGKWRSSCDSKVFRVILFASENSTTLFSLFNVLIIIYQRVLSYLVQSLSYLCVPIIFLIFKIFTFNLFFKCSHHPSPGVPSDSSSHFSSLCSQENALTPTLPNPVRPSYCLRLNFLEV